MTMPRPIKIDPAYRRRVRLKGGVVVQVRLIGLPDRDRFVAGFERLSPESRYRRFFVPVARLREDMITRLLDTDNWDHLALGAEVLGGNGQPVGRSWQWPATSACASAPTPPRPR